MNRWIVPGIPFLFSFTLSLVTVGNRAYWQDSAAFLTAVHELGVLYPPGFFLYVLLCNLWTKLLFFVDFTLAVHLFSSICAAAAAGAMAVAVRDLLRSRGKVFRVFESDPGPVGDSCGILVGVLLSSGYTFWSSAIYAKGYAFYYLILALLLWRMIRADESGHPRDFGWVAAFIGLAWQAHPSASLSGLALILFVAFHARVLGAKAVAIRVLIAAACALGPLLILLPIFKARGPWLMMDSPQTAGDVALYALGRTFVTREGVFGVETTRLSSFGQFVWEELLGIGMLLAVAGLASLARRNRRLLVGVLAWMVPYAAVTILFKMEGQHDFWFIAAWMPLYLAIGIGACGIALRVRARAQWMLAALGLAGVAWALPTNLSDVSQRKYDLAELFGRTILDPVDPNAILILSGDEINFIPGYLQRVRGMRPDVTLVSSSFLPSMVQGRPWYLDTLLRRHSFLMPPDVAGVASRHPEASPEEVVVAAILNANAEGDRPIFLNRGVPSNLLRSDFRLAPAGVVWKLVPAGGVAPLEQRYWKFPIEPEIVRMKYRRERGQSVTTTAEGLEVRPVSYEGKFVSLLLRGRLRLVQALVERRQFAPAIRLCESILAVDDQFAGRNEVIHFLAISHYASGDAARAGPFLRASAETNPHAPWRATARFYLGEIARKNGDEAAAQEHFRSALSTPGLHEDYRKEMESRLAPK